MTDRELLKRYVADRDERAFGELVNRHAAMVHAAAYRMAGADDADDIAQAVFLLLARKAARLKAHRNLAGWLYNVTRFCARNARRGRSRRIKHVTAAAGEIAMNLQPNTKTEARALDAGIVESLDAGLARLREPQRQVVILRYVEGMTMEETAAQLGVSASAVAKRSERGLGKLRAFLASRGYAGTTSTLAAALPSQLARLTDPQRAGLVKTSAGVASSSATALAASGGRILAAISAAKVAAGIALVAAGVAGGVIAISSARASSSKVRQVAIAPATQPTQLTQAQGKIVADQFFAALRNRDVQKVADLLDVEPEPQRKAKAVQYVGQFRDGIYAKFPARLGGTVNSMFTSSSTGEMTEAILDANTPTEADVRRLTITLRPVAGQWRVHDAALSSTEAVFIAWPQDVVVNGPATAPTDTYRKALAALHKLQADNDFDPKAPMSEQSKPKMLAMLSQSQTDLRAFATTLKGTDLAIDDDTVNQLVDWMEQTRKGVETRGVDVIKDAAANMPHPLAEAGGRIFEMGTTLSARIDAADDARHLAADAHHTGPRAPSFSPAIPLTLGWNNASFQLPGPLKMPEWFAASETFKLWRKRHNVQTFKTRDDEGNIYEIHCMGGSIDAEGGEHDMIPSIRQYRPDGTLAATATFDENGRALEWQTLDPTGLKYTMHASRGRESDLIRHLMFYDPDGTQRQWHLRDNNLVWWEESTDAAGGDAKTLHIVYQKAATTAASAKP